MLIWPDRNLKAQLAATGFAGTSERHKLGRETQECV